MLKTTEAQRPIATPAMYRSMGANIEAATASVRLAQMARSVEAKARKRAQRN